MPELRSDTDVSREIAKGECFDMNNNEKGAKMALSGTRSLLLWCRQQTEGYSEVNVYNMTSSWRDGLGFCAIIHRYRPDLIDFERLSKENILENNELAFSTAEKYLGIPVVLDASDMIENAIPDKLSVITYVSQLCEYFKNKTPANQGFSTKMNILPKTRTESTGHKGSKRSSHQIYTLSGHAKRMATALRNVFRSDTKDDSSKNKELSGSKHVGVDPLRASTETNRNSDELQVLTRPVKKVPFLGTDCFICHSKVFIMERLIVERKLFHRSCFRCEKCNACLRPGTYHYSPETEKFGCLFDCTGGHREKPIKIKFEPLSDPQLCRSPRSSPLNRSPNLSDSNSKKSQQQSKSSLQRQFSVVKRNAITIGALPQKLNQGNLPAVSKSPRQSYSSRTSESLGQKSEGDKKRRFSSSSKSNNKRGGKAKNGQLMEQGGDEKNKSSLSPVSKRRAPDSTLEGAPSEEIDGKDSIKITFTLDETNESSPKVDLVACESGNQPNEEFKEKPFVLKTKEVCRTKADEAHGSGAPSINLSFSFKDELLKRADETRTNESNADYSIIQINLSSCENASREEEQLEGNLAQKNDNDDDVEESKKEQESSRDGVAEGDSETDEPVSMNGSLQDEIEPPIPAKSVQRLREKFLNINDLIDTKHKNNLAKKQSEMDRELRSIAAFKKQRDTSSPKLRKWSANSVEKPKQEISCSRKSVKELRKRYMANGGNENRSKNEKSSSERIRSVSAPAGNRKGSTDGSDGVVSESSSISSQGGRERRATEPESNNNHSLPFEETFGEEASEQNENCDDVGMVTVISVDPNSEESEGSKTSSLLISPENFGRMSHETMTYTIIKSEDVSSDSPLPSFEIHPSSPELPRSKPSSPSHRDLHTSGLKGHAASHDSGIDMPSSTQGTCQTSVPEAVASEQLTTMLDKATTVFCLPTSDESSGFGREQLSSETGSDLQSTDCPWSPSPSSDFSPEVFWSRPLSVGSTASCTETSSSCSSPRMSVIIAQESSTTKINSRFFTVETMEPWEFEDNKFVEERQCVMEIEGEFQFGRERSKTSRAEREAIFSLHRDAKTSSVNSCDLIKEEEITLSPVEIESELQTLETLHAELEKRGVDIEQNLRESMDSERPYNNSEDELLQEWLTVVQERNVVLRRESELIYLLQSQNYEERYRTVEGELRKLVAMRDEVKSSDDVKRERELLSELLELVQKRSFIVDNLEEDRVREIQEDEKIEQAKTEGMTALPGNRWDQRPDCTKVAFSRFYC